MKSLNYSERRRGGEEKKNTFVAVRVVTDFTDCLKLYQISSWKGFGHKKKKKKTDKIHSGMILNGLGGLWG